MLIHFGVTPYIVFDGDYLPSKAATEADRAQRREDSKKLGFELLNAGKTSQAYLEFQKAVDVTPEMARQLIDELKAMGVQYVVAPYEADAQMVFLERKGIISAILSEDSDLLVFGAKCLLTKLDQYGNCVEINKDDFSACREITLTGWSEREFRQMAILSGCDYLASITNMGLKTAYRMVRKHKTIERVVRMLQFDGKYHVPKDYLESFYRAERTFLHQRVYCPVTKTLVFHTELDGTVDEADMPFIGAYVEPEIAQGVARGDLNPMTKKRIVVDSRAPLSASRALPRVRANQNTPGDPVKKGVPISEYFKAKRTPLAELDPNAFTPSPSQQEALRRNPDSWIADPVPVTLPRVYLSRSATEPELPRSAPSGLGRGRTLSSGTVNSRLPPSKRARLCEDESDIDTPTGESVGETRSRFFASATTGPSPSVAKAARKAKGKKKAFTIFSDDSVEEAMLSLPDPSPKVSSTQRPVSTADAKDKKAYDVEEVPADLAKSETEEEVDSQATNNVPDLTQTSFAEPPSSTGESEPELESAPIVNFKEKFGFTKTPSVFMKNGMPTPPSSVRTSQVPANTKPAPALMNSGYTPLQRLGATAINKGRRFSADTPPYTPPTGARRTSLLSRVPFPEVARPGLGRAKTSLTNLGHSIPANVPLPAQDESEIAALKAEPHGSEDLLVRDSEASDYEDNNDQEAPKDDNARKFDEEEILSSPPSMTKTINLGRFVFTP